ncbi:hypothetical protein TNCV_1381701 [Trichonephila clavipes]|nr:hypothetical protein TNCV_1381701 [Trichonephila clavipes]
MTSRFNSNVKGNNISTSPAFTVGSSLYPGTPPIGDPCGRFRMENKAWASCGLVFYHCRPGDINRELVPLFRAAPYKRIPQTPQHPERTVPRMVPKDTVYNRRNLVSCSDKFYGSRSDTDDLMTLVTTTHNDNILLVVVCKSR